MYWPDSAQDLIALQYQLSEARPPPWTLPAGTPVVAGCFVCFARGLRGRGGRGDRAWAAAALLDDAGLVLAAVTGAAEAAYEPGLLALREGPLLEAAVRALPRRPDVLLVNATGRDHPRRAGLALHLGAVLDLPTVGVTDRPLVAAGPWPPDEAGAATPLLLNGEPVGAWVRTKAGARPVAVHAAWRSDPATAAALVLGTCSGARTPEPLRRARHAARRSRAGHGPTPVLRP